jgi:hypothetical protein
VAATTPRGRWEEEVVVDVPADLAVADLALDLTVDDVTDGSSVLACALLHVPDPLPGKGVAANLGTVDLAMDEEVVKLAHDLLHAPDLAPHLVGVEEEEAATPSMHAPTRPPGRRGYCRSSSPRRREGSGGRRGT